MKNPVFSDDNTLNNLIINSWAYPVLYFDTDFHLVYANTSFLNLIDPDKQQVQGKTLEQLGFPENKCKEWHAVLKNVYNSRSAVTIDSTFTLSDDRNCSFRLSLMPISNNADQLTGVSVFISKVKFILEEKQDKNEDNFLKLVEKAPDIIAIHTDEKFVFINSIGLDLLKYNAKENIVGMPLWNVIHPDFCDQAKARIRKNYDASLLLPAVESRFICSDGSGLDVDLKSVCITFRGKPSILIIARDNTERLKKDRAMADLNNQHLNLINAIPDIITFKDSEGNLIIVNEAAKQFFKLEGHRWEGKTLKSVTSNVYKKKSIALETAAVADVEDAETWKNGKLTVFNRPIHDQDGRLRHLELRKVPVYTSDGKPKSLITIAADISKRKEEEMRLRLLEMAIENSNDSIQIIEINKTDITKSKVIYVNDGCCKMIGFKKEELIGFNPRIFRNMKSDKTAKDLYHDAVMKNKSFTMEILDSKKDGTKFWSYLSMTPFFNAEGASTHWIGIKRDVTEEKEHDQNIKRAILQGQENEKAFVGRELHDNVAQIMVGAKLSLGMLKATTEKEKKWLKEANENINDAINELRILSHNLAPSSFKHANFINHIERLLKSINKNKQFTIILSADELDKISLTSELKLNLYRILQEQLQNIIKHAEATLVKIEIRIVENYIKMTISDDGKGFDSSASTTGIGIQNIRTRIETFSGVCSIRSSIGNGCEMVLEVPYVSN